MKVLHVIPSVSPRRGGPSTVIRSLTQGLSLRGHEVHVATTDDDGPQHRTGATGSHNENGVTYHYFRRNAIPYTLSVSFFRWLWKHASDYDLLHIHAVFSFPSDVAAAIAYIQSVPYIIRPLGILGQWGLRHNRPFLKRMLYYAYLRTLLSHASTMHYTSGQERREAESMGFKATAVVLPNPVDIPPPHDGVQELFRLSFPDIGARPYLLFLSRIDRKKGLDLLIPAFAAVRKSFPDLALVIAGEGTPAYITELKAIVDSHNLRNDIFWVGFVSGDRKTSAYVDSELFVLSSYSENFGVAPVEAMALGTPIVISDAVGIHEDITLCSAGIVVEQNIDSIARGITLVLSTPALRRQLTGNAVAMIHTHYSLEAVCSKLEHLYRSLCASPV